MTGSAEIPKRGAKMAQGRKAGERPPDEPQDQFKKLPGTTKKLLEKKIREILDNERNEN